MLNDSRGQPVVSEEVAEMREEVNSLEKEVELRTAQINDLQQKLLDVDQGRCTTQWQAECVLQHRWWLHGYSFCRKTVGLTEWIMDVQIDIAIKVA